LPAQEVDGWGIMGRRHNESMLDESAFAAGAVGISTE
jgi:hypothetical protein